MARCQNGSANRAKAKAKVARAHRKVRHARQDFLHRASTRLVRENDVIVIEDLNVAGMVRNRHLARAISDCSWGEFRRQLGTSASGTAAAWWSSTAGTRRPRPARRAGTCSPT
jgi:putative transposase